VDPKPKYYKHQAYKNPSYGASDELVKKSLSNSGAQTIQEGPLSAHLVKDSSEDHIRVQIRGEASRQLLWNEAVDGLCGDAGALRMLIANVMKAMPYEAFFWECAPVSPATVGTRRFEFVVLPAKGLEMARVDPIPFADHLDDYRGQAIARTFTNLGGDSTLVVPTWADPGKQDPATYTHIARFFREAPEVQQMTLLQELGFAVRQRLQTVHPKTTLWVSTAGLGVYWLHMRVDPKPKYYKHQAYKNPSYGASDELVKRSLSNFGAQTIQEGPLSAHLVKDPCLRASLRTPCQSDKSAKIQRV